MSKFAVYTDDSGIIPQSLLPSTANSIILSHLTADSELRPNEGFVADGAGSRVFSLPVAPPPIGTTFSVYGGDAAGWRITQNAGEVIVFGEKTTPTGVGGYLESTDSKDHVELIYIGSGQYRVRNAMGTLSGLA